MSAEKRGIGHTTEGRAVAPPTEAELAAVDQALAGLAPLEPSARAIARTQAALVLARANQRRRVVLGRVFVAAAAVLASVGAAVLGRTGADGGDAPSVDAVAQMDPSEPRLEGRAGPETAPAQGTDKANKESATVDLPPAVVQGGEAVAFESTVTRGPGPRTANPAGTEVDTWGWNDAPSGAGEGQGFLAGKPDLAQGFWAGAAPSDKTGDGSSVKPAETVTLVENAIVDGRFGDVTFDYRGTARVVVQETDEETKAGKKEEVSAKGEKAKPKGPGKGVEDIEDGKNDKGGTDYQYLAGRDDVARGEESGLAVLRSPDAPDVDGDGVADQQDRCSTGEGAHGDDDGCPDALDNGLRVADPVAANRKGRETGEQLGDQFRLSLLDAEQNMLAREERRALARSELRVVTGKEAAPTFIAATGYFANTYVPGDPQIAFLRQAVGQGFEDAGRRVALSALARPVAQPFDAPRDQALALQLSADRTAVEGPTRMLLQVGLSGAAQAPSRRAPLAVAMVVDLGSIGGGGQAAAGETDRRTLWGIAQAFVGERREGDTMSLVVPVGSGAEVLAGAALTTTDVARFLASALERTRAAGGNAGAGLVAAVERAYAEVHRGMAADAALGAHVVVLATARAAALPSELTTRAHAEALRNVQLAVVTTARGADAGPDGSAALAAAGQGRRWVVARPEEAGRVVTQELGAAGRAVARAVRLRIRLAPGVKLVAVLGSHPLAVPETARVREAERAIDRKVAETTGIREDRGADEDGIQIVIPAFMADDDHPILLEVVVPGPGPVLDVRARFKDLVRMQNGETQASLALESGASQATRLTRNVVENHAAHVVATALREAATALAGGDPGMATTRLEAAQGALARLALASPGARLGGANDLLAACRKLVAVPAATWTEDPARGTHVAQSMLLAAAIQAGAR